MDSVAIEDGLANNALAELPDAGSLEDESEPEQAATAMSAATRVGAVRRMAVVPVNRCPSRQAG